MGLFLLLTLSIFFGWCFTEHKNRKLEQLRCQLEHEKLMRKRESENHEFIMRKFRATIEELLRG